MSSTISINQLPSRQIWHNGQDYLFFSGTAYLGMQQHPVFQQHVADALRQYGTVFGSSRNGNLRLGIYGEAETQLVTLFSKPDNQPEAALTLSSGMLAGQVVVQWLRQQSARLLYAPGTHPALWDGPSISLPALSFADWSRQIADQVRVTDTTRPIAILTNSLDAVRSETYAFDWVHDLPNDRLITLVVDDSHGLGLLNDGRSIWPQLPRRDNLRVVVTGSLAKAMGLPGGVVLSDTHTLTALRQTAYFGACSPIPPAYMAALVQSVPLYSRQYQQLQQRIDAASALLLPTGLFRQAANYPVFYTDHDHLYSFLLGQNTLIYSFAYPTPADRPNTRIIISAFHEMTDIQQLAEKVNRYVHTT
jgi:7-keto-8-aminopelargonate synthetase-like enzyme